MTNHVAWLAFDAEKIVFRKILGNDFDNAVKKTFSYSVQGFMTLSSLNKMKHL